MNVRRENDGKGPAWQETNGDWRMSNVVGVSKYFFFFLLPPPSAATSYPFLNTWH